MKWGWATTTVEHAAQETRGTPCTWYECLTCQKPWLLKSKMFSATTYSEHIGQKYTGILTSLFFAHRSQHFKPTAQNESKSLRFFMSFSMVPDVHHQCLLQKLSETFWSTLSKELVKKLNIFFGERAYMTKYSPICHTPLLQLPSWHIAVFILSYA